MDHEWQAAESRLLEVWMALRRTAVRKPSPQNQAAADAAFAAYRDHLLRRLPQQQPARHDDGAVSP